MGAVSRRIGGNVIIKTSSYKRVPPVRDWGYLSNSGVTWDSKMTVLPQYPETELPDFLRMGSDGPAARHVGNTFGVYQKTDQIFNNEPVYRRVETEEGGLEFFFFFTSSNNWVVGNHLSNSGGVVRTDEEGHFSPLELGWRFKNGLRWYLDDKMHVEKYTPQNTSVSESTSQPTSVSQSASIEYLEVGATEVWSDDGTHAANDFSCWNPVLPTSGEYGILASIPRDNYRAPSKAFVFKSNEEGTFSHPERYNFLWNDKRTGASKTVSFWQPQCGAGYKALGIFCHNSRRAPATSDMLCVRELMVKECDYNWVWDSENTGSFREVSVFQSSDPLVQAMGGAANMTTNLGGALCLNRE